MMAGTAPELNARNGCLGGIELTRRMFIVALLSCSSVALAEPQDLIVNGGFEQGLTGWSYPGLLVENAVEAHTGQSCVSAGVSAPNQAVILSQRVQLSENAVYKIQYWARSDNGNKIPIWIIRDDERINLAQIKNIAATWTEYGLSFSVDEPGEWELQLIAPSSYNAPLGQVWVDDVTLIEYPVPPSTPLSPQDGIHDYPALAADRHGHLYSSWIEDLRGTDRLWLSIATADEQGVTTQLEHVFDLEASSIESVVLAGDEDGAWGCAALETDKGWDLFVFHVTAEGQRSEWYLPRDEAVDIHPTIAVSGDRVWVVWESNREGKRQIHGRALPPQRDSPTVLLSDGSDSSYFPTLTGDGEGRLWAAWEQFIDGQYDIVLAEYDGSQWKPARRLTDNVWLEHRPSLAWTPHGLWGAWEMSEFPSYRTSYADWQRVIVAKIEPDGLSGPADAWDVFSDWHSNPRLLWSPHGNLYLSTRTSRGRNSNWDVKLTAFDGERWGPSQIVSRDAGRSRAAPLAEAAGQIWVSLQNDNINGTWNSVEQAGGVVSQLRLASLPSNRGRRDWPELPRIDWPPSSFEPQTLRQSFGEDRERFTIDYEGQELKLYFGQFHEHSSISVCNRRGDLSPDDNYTHNRDIHRMDFSALTDHGYNLSPHIWSYLAKLARWQHDPGRYVTFLAEEWTSSFEDSTAQHPLGFYGHRNLILGDTHYPRWFNSRDGATPAELWETLKLDQADFIHIPHQLADVGNVPVDWDYVDEEAQPVAEIFQHRGSYEHAGAPREAHSTAPGYFLQDAWAQGVFIGVIASPDHGGGRGKAAVYAPELTRQSILDGCRSRHTYGTTGAKIWLDVRVDGHLMGEKVAVREGAVPIHIDVSGPGVVSVVEIWKSNRLIHTAPLGQSEGSVDFVDPESPIDGTYYYVRVQQTDQELAWSSPVWFVDPERLDEIQHREGFPEIVD